MHIFDWLCRYALACFYRSCADRVQKPRDACAFCQRWMGFLSEVTVKRWAAALFCSYLCVGLQLGLTCSEVILTTRRLACDVAFRRDDD